MGDDSSYDTFGDDQESYDNHNEEFLSRNIQPDVSGNDQFSNYASSDESESCNQSEVSDEGFYSDNESCRRNFHDDDNSSSHCKMSLSAKELDDSSYSHSNNGVKIQR